MPRVKLAGDRYKDQDLAELIRRYKYGKRYTNEEIAKKVGICERSWDNYMKDPSRMPLRVIRAMQRVLQIPKEEMAAFLV